MILYVGKDLAGRMLIHPIVLVIGKKFEKNVNIQ